MARNFGTRQRQHFNRFWNESRPGDRDAAPAVVLTLVVLLIIAAVGIVLA